MLINRRLWGFGSRCFAVATETEEHPGATGSSGGQQSLEIIPRFGRFMLDPGTASFDLLLCARGVTTNMSAKGEERDNEDCASDRHLEKPPKHPTDKEAAHITDANTHVARHRLASI